MSSVKCLCWGGRGETSSFHTRMGLFERPKATRGSLCPRVVAHHPAGVPQVCDLDGNLTSILWLEEVQRSSGVTRPCGRRHGRVCRLRFTCKRCKKTQKKVKKLTTRRGRCRWSGGFACRLMWRGRNPPPAEVTPGADGVQTVSEQEGVPLQQQLRTFDLRQTGGAPGDGGSGDLRQGRSVSLRVRRTRVSSSTPVLPRQSL